MKRLALKGDIVFTPTKDRFQVHRDSYLVSEEGKIVGIFKELQERHKDYHLKITQG